ncbi:MAG: universal stress protein [Alphaproteobacteria bacterium]|nr:universal stress protein [Alphaproteobacteria bacterium]
MPLRTLIVHGDSSDSLSTRVALAIAVAREHDAKLTVVYPLEGAAATLMYAEHVPLAAIQQQIEAERQRATEIRASVAERVAREGVRLDWRTMEGRPASLLTSAGAVADAIVMSQDEEDAELPLVATVVLTAGRPVLCVPRRGSFSTCGRRVIVAWNGSREATRAMHDSLPFLQRAEQVQLFAADAATEGAASLEDAAAHLAAHGAKVELRRGQVDDKDAGAAILDAAATFGADLIVMGAYGHSRLREWVFGGATRTVLHAMTIPTLLSS